MQTLQLNKLFVGINKINNKGETNNTLTDLRSPNEKNTTMHMVSQYLTFPTL